MDKAFFHFSKINNDKYGNLLRVVTPKLGRFSKRFDAYIIKNYGNEKQVADGIRALAEKAGYSL